MKTKKVILSNTQKKTIQRRIDEIREAFIIKMAKQQLGDTELTPSMAKKIRTTLAKAKRINSQIGDKKRPKSRPKPRRTKK